MIWPTFTSDGMRWMQKVGGVVGGLGKSCIGGGLGPTPLNLQNLSKPPTPPTFLLILLENREEMEQMIIW